MGSIALGVAGSLRPYDFDVRRGYEGIADEYDAFVNPSSPYFKSASDALLRLLGPGSGSCLDLGCGGGHFSSIPTEMGWNLVGIDASADQLRVARGRHPTTRLVLTNAARLPFASDVFDAVVSTFTHTDFDDFAGAVGESRRVLRQGGRFVYIGNHPCFVGPTQEHRGSGVPRLYPGYRRAGRWLASEALGTTPGGWRARVGSFVHLPLADFLTCFGGFTIETVEEIADGFEYPKTIALTFSKP